MAFRPISAPRARKWRYARCRRRQAAILAYLRGAAGGWALRRNVYGARKHCQLLYVRIKVINNENIHG